MSTDAPAPEPPPGRPEPVGALERVEAIDVVRGFALLGVLTMNLLYWFRTTPLRYALDPHPWPGAADRAFELAAGVLGSAKFMSLFSILFGIGLSIQLQRAEARGARFYRFAARRLGVLLLFGALHILLIWMGDILHIYALLGFLLLLFLRRKTKTLLIWIACLLALPVVVSLAVMLVRGPEPTPEPPPDLEALRRDLDATVQAYAHGDWLDVARQRLREYRDTVGILVGASYIAFVAFLTGLVAWRSGALQRPAEHRPLLRRVFLVGLLFGLPINAFQSALRGWEPGGALRALRVVFQTIEPAAIIALALSYGAGILLLLTRPSWQARLRFFGQVGRMALTNYLMQSVLCGLIFYGYGLGLYDQLSPLQGMAVVVAVYAAQVVWSRLWMRRYRFGPAEWLWRTLTYGEAQPMRASAG